MAKAKSKTKNSQAVLDVRTVLTDHIGHRVREALFIITIAVSLFLLVALCSYHRSDPGWSHYSSVHAIKNVTGKVGAWFADFILYMCGYLAYVFPLLISYLAWTLYRSDECEDNPKIGMMLLRSLGFVMVVLAGSALANLYLTPSYEHLPFDSGGVIGNVIAHSLVIGFNPVGTGLMLIAIVLIGVTLLTGLSWLNLMEYIGRAVLTALASFKQAVLALDWQYFKYKLQECLKRKPKVVKPKEVSNRVEPEIMVPPDVKPVSKPRQLLEKITRLAPQVPDEPSVQVAKAKSAPLLSQVTFKKPKVGAMPKLSLLDSPDQSAKCAINHQLLNEQSRDVEIKLADFNVEAKVVAVHPGPVVTRFELQLAAGTKVSKISALAKDLARSLSVVSVRVVEVIPGKSVIGLELPNESREIVRLQEIIASKQYKAANFALTLALGKDIAGHAVIVDLAKMPHLLVAGTTGSGKSVNLNAMLLSLLYKSSPADLRMILIDPKMLELAVYDGIPHLLTPVVTDMKDAASALRWCVAEMERRYRLMAALGVRNIAGYNTKIREARLRGEPIKDPLVPKSEREQAAELNTLPQIVVLADEFADMMVVVGKKVETLIARLAQKARAAGIHLILATQRPSVDVITGLIKANIPTRIAFQVSSKIDSRTIIDQQGAEQLLGHGDMLYLPPGSGVPVRVHGAYVSDDEVHRVVSFLKQTASPEYLDDILDMGAQGASGDPVVDAVMSADDDAEKDSLYDEAVDFIVRARRVSVSSVQRRFKIGYNRAARIVEAMEAAGIVSASDGSSGREVLVPPPKD